MPKTLSGYARNFSLPTAAIFHILLLASNTALAEEAVPPAAPPAAPVVPAALGYWMAGAATFAAVIAIVAVVAVLFSKTKWSLSDAVSEEVDFTFTSGAKETRLVASTSRLIALFGLIILLALYLTVGSAVIFRFVTTGGVPDLSGLLKFFLGGLGLFVPYAVNQARAAFSP